MYNILIGFILGLTLSVSGACLLSKAFGGTQAYGVTQAYDDGQFLVASESSDKYVPCMVKQTRKLQFDTLETIMILESRGDITSKEAAKMISGVILPIAVACSRVAAMPEPENVWIPYVKGIRAKFLKRS